MTERIKINAHLKDRLARKLVHTNYDETLALIREHRLRPMPDREGQCFRYAYEASISGFGDFVIGTMRGKDAPRMFHAVAQSLDLEPVYYDGVLDACFEGNVYLRIFGWIPVLRMSSREARAFGVRTGKCPTPLTLGFPSLAAVENEIRSVLIERRTCGNAT